MEAQDRLRQIQELVGNTTDQRIKDKISTIKAEFNAGINDGDHNEIVDLYENEIRRGLDVDYDYLDKNYFNDVDILFNKYLAQNGNTLCEARDFVDHDDMLRRDLELVRREIRVLEDLLN